jgi:hypothetical protein
MAKPVKTSSLRRTWDKRIAQALTSYKDLHLSGDKVVNQYRIENRSSVQQEKFNILYSNTETIKPSLYSQTPKTEVEQRVRDQDKPVAVASSLLLEACVDYTIKEQDFDQIIEGAIEDYLLPGLGVVWLRYEPTFGDPIKDPNSGDPVLDKDGKPELELTSEAVAIEYGHWKDFLTNKCRRWSEVWWVAKGSWMDKEEVRKRFGGPVANKMTYTSGSEVKQSTDNQSIEEGQARIWEIWDKRTKKVVWFSPNYPDDVLDVKDDFLKLKGFFPCPRPLRAITTNNIFIPRPFYSQYQAQADELNDITSKIRKLVDALRVVGVYDGSVETLSQLLTGTGNKMVKVEGWSTVQDKGGLKGVVDFLPIAEVANVLMQLYDARERVKNEIYEITGWSDIIRGVSKASETLGAQELKSQWAGSRLKRMQKEIQRFIRDILRMVGELISEHYGDDTLLLLSGVDIEADETGQLAQLFQQVVTLIRNERDRCALINIESDSTLLPDEANDKKERTEFLGAVGAFLQQSVPAAQQTPALGPLLGEILMFTVKSFRSARTLEQTFKQFTQTMSQQPPKKEDDGKAAAEAGKTQVAQINAQTKQMEVQAEQSTAVQELQLEDKHHNDKMMLERMKLEQAHALAMEDRKIEMAKIELERAKVGIAQETVNLNREKAQDDSSHRDADRDVAREKNEQQNSGIDGN